MDQFIVVAPPYSGHKDVRALHTLAGTLERLGYHCRMVIFDPDGVRQARVGELNLDVSAPPLTRESAVSIHDSIVIYPEIMPVNTLGADRVVWYLQNPSKRIKEEPNDYFLAGSKALQDPRVRHVLYYPSVGPEFCLGDIPVLWKDRRLEMMLDHGAYGLSPSMPGVISFGDSFLRNPGDRAQLFRIAKRVFVWGSRSAAAEAVLCGAMPVTMQWGPWDLEDEPEDELGRIPHMMYGDYGEGMEWRDMIFPLQCREFEMRVDGLRSSWEDRVRVFADDAIAHFKRG